MAEKPAWVGVEQHRLDAVTLEEYARLLNDEACTPEFRDWMRRQRDKGHAGEPEVV